jgi:hypothetical protein
MDARIKSGHDECGSRGEPGDRFARIPTSIFKQPTTFRYASAPSRRDAPELCRKTPPRKQRAWGMPGARCTRSRACRVESTRVSHHGRTGITRHSRTRVVLTVSFALSPVIGLSCHRHQRNCFHRLDAGVEASGPHDFTVRFSAVRQRHCRVHRIPPRVRDDRDTPLQRDETARDIDLIWGKREGEYFWK